MSQLKLPTFEGRDVDVSSTKLTKAVDVDDPNLPVGALTFHLVVGQVTRIDHARDRAERGGQTSLL